MSVRLRFVSMLLNSREHAVADRVPVVEHAVRSAEEARAEDGVGLAVEDRLEQRRPVRGIVLEIGVLDDHDVAGARGERRADGRALPAFSGWQISRSMRPCGEQLSRISRVPSVEQSSTQMISFRSAYRAPGRGWIDGVPLVVDRDEHGKLERMHVQRRQVARLRSECERLRGNGGHGRRSEVIAGER